MLFNIIGIVGLIYVLILPTVMFYMFARLLESAEKGEPVKVVKVPIKRKHKKPKLSVQEQRVIDILGNIDAYDGTSVGQKKIEE
jgi:hypothetical protein